MARHLIMGYYTCNLGHNHSTNEEMKECNRIEEESNLSRVLMKNDRKTFSITFVRLLRDHSLAKENVENERIAAAAEMQKREIEHEKEKMRHQERLAELDLQRMKAEQERKPPKSKICALS